MANLHLSSMISLFLALIILISLVAFSSLCLITPSFLEISFFFSRDYYLDEKIDSAGHGRFGLGMVNLACAWWDF